jgi:biopolymer transport protein ExbD
MAIGGFGNDEAQGLTAEINTTPLVDVMLVLMVIFLVTAPMLNHAVKLQLPNERATEIREKAPLVVSIDANGVYYRDDAKVTEEELDRIMQDAAQADAKRPVHLRADESVPYGKVGRFLATAQRLGLTNIGFITAPK